MAYVLRNVATGHFSRDNINCQQTVFLAKAHNYRRLSAALKAAREIALNALLSLQKHPVTKANCPAFTAGLYDGRVLTLPVAVQDTVTGLDVPYTATLRVYNMGPASLVTVD
jgi:hypothetical protein